MDGVALFGVLALAGVAWAHYGFTPYRQRDR